MKVKRTTKDRNFDQNSNELMWNIKLAQVKGILEKLKHGHCFNESFTKATNRTNARRV